MARLAVSPSTYRKITLGALGLLTLIVVSGGAVRLTGSGLGCSDWPACENDQLVAPWELHAMVEFINRLVTGLVSAVVIAAVLGSHWRTPRRGDLIWLSWGLVAGVVAQILLGGLLVLYELPPVLVIGHFLLSMVLLWNAVVLHRRAALEVGAPVPRTDRLGAAVLVLTSAVIVTGTIVTGAGPHGGDEDAERIDIAVRDIAQIHGALVVLLLLVLGGLVWLLRHWNAPEARQRSARTLLGVALAQGLIGYVQYFTGVPALLVGAHILGAALLWIATVSFSLATPENLAVPAGRRLRQRATV